ncbi:MULTISPECIES: hypothetical protein [Streptomyces]|uniref:hypothetical protein n=1 Tax=Streptomyces TaxID=1883 RepID=UPI000998C329|nr:MULTISPECIES: hypothetical protein [Streptomyces]
MSDDWTWDYDPDAEHVVGGLPHEVVAEVERLAEHIPGTARAVTDARLRVVAELRLQPSASPTAPS